MPHQTPTFHIFALWSEATNALTGFKKALEDMEVRLRRLSARVEKVDTNLGSMQKRLKKGSDQEATTLREYRKYCETSNSKMTKNINCSNHKGSSCH